MRSRPSRQKLLDAELSIRTLHAYAGILQGRLALARVTATRQEFAHVTDSQLAHAAVACANATEAIDAILDSVAPELASTAAAVADLSCQREFDMPRPPVAGHLRLATVESERPA